MRTLQTATSGSGSNRCILSSDALARAILFPVQTLQTDLGGIFSRKPTSVATSPAAFAQMVRKVCFRWRLESSEDAVSSCQVIFSLCQCGRSEIRVLIQLVSTTPPGPTHLPNCMQDTLEVLEVRLPSMLLVCFCGFPLTFCTCLRGMAHGTGHCLSVCANLKER